MVSMSGKSGNVLELESGEGNVGQLTECRGGGILSQKTVHCLLQVWG